MQTSLRLAFVATAIAAVSACGGGGGGDDAPAAPPPPPPPPPAVTPVSITVMDGLLQNALVCLDANASDACDSGEVQGRTAADGKVTLQVPDADLGKHPVLAMVGTDAVDADGGAVTTAYLLKAPADRTAVVSPWTTLVADQRVATGVTTDEAANALQRMAGLSVSPMADYAAASDAGSVTAARAGRVLVAVVQRQLQALLPLAGQADAGGQTMTAAAIQAMVSNRMSSIAVAAVDAAGGLQEGGACATAASDACRQAIAAAATSVYDGQPLKPASLPVFAEVQRILAQSLAATGPNVPSTRGFSLDSLNPGDANNWFYRILMTDSAGAVADANGLYTTTDLRVRNVDGTQTRTSWTNDAARQGDLHWSGTAWVACPIGSIIKAGARTAGGVNRTDACEGLVVSQTRQVEQDISGKTLGEVGARLDFTRPALGAPLAGFAEPPDSVGDAVFPPGSMLRHRWSSDMGWAITYDVRSTNQVGAFSAEVAAGGDRQVNPDVACGIPANQVSAPADGLDMLIARFRGTPCLFAGPGSVTVNGTQYTSPARVQWWGQSTVSIGTVNGPASQAAAYWSQNRLIRVAFTGAGQATYYSCLQRWTDGMPGDCTTLGTGGYTVATLGDARVLTFDGMPPQAARLTYDRVFVERGGRVYFGFRNKSAANSYAPRLNDVAGNAVLTQLGIPAVVVP